MSLLPSVGVIIPTYNRAQLTIRAVESALAQTLPANQVIVVDDGSDEEQLELLKKALIDKPVDILSIKHFAHPGIAREFGRKHLTTDWVAFLDSDDTWQEDKLERIFKYQVGHKAEAICSSAFGINTLRKSKRGSRYLQRREIFRRNEIINSSVVIKSSILELIGGIAISYSVRGCEDYATWLRVSDHVDWFYVDEPLITYTDDSVDSIRKEIESLQGFSNIAALLDYVLYARRTRNANFYFLRLILKFAWRFII